MTREEALQALDQRGANILHVITRSGAIYETYRDVIERITADNDYIYGTRINAPHLAGPFRRGSNLYGTTRWFYLRNVSLVAKADTTLIIKKDATP